MAASGVFGPQAEQKQQEAEMPLREPEPSPELQVQSVVPSVTPVQPAIRASAASFEPPAEVMNAVAGGYREQG